MPSYIWSNARAQVDDEDAAVMNLIKSDDWVVMLDENGQDIGSERMAELVGDAGNTGASRLSFCIGGPYGHGRQLRKRANLSIKLSTLVLNHQIAVLVLMEQLYRLTHSGISNGLLKMGLIMKIKCYLLHLINIFSCFPVKIH
ncbi:putative RNA methyltransferase At5g10620 isoform X2 [Corylus avellana]|uniref:putative RNA methyltransferase At5g10620 isoform X2 n=1 Tax=Corylus avellana TaxID=13451 RepID=UPI00286A8700|nr:putative RNA methyltransferase At5g10620 isoform X2 [Corylus avellana]